MARERATPGTPQDWLARARGDLAMAHVPLPEGGFYEDLCFHAQQAAEKAIKAIYRHHGLGFRYTHDLDSLLTGLVDQGISIPEMIYECAVLTLFAWETRYPGVGMPVSREEYLEAMQQAETVVTWAEQILDKVIE